MFVCILRVLWKNVAEKDNINIYINIHDDTNKSYSSLLCKDY